MINKFKTILGSGTSCYQVSARKLHVGKIWERKFRYGTLTYTLSEDLLVGKLDGLSDEQLRAKLFRSYWDRAAEVEGVEREIDSILIGNGSWSWRLRAINISYLNDRQVINLSYCYSNSYCNYIKGLIVVTGNPITAAISQAIEADYTKLSASFFQPLILKSAVIEHSGAKQLIDRLNFEVGYFFRFSWGKGEGSEAGTALISIYADDVFLHNYAFDSSSIFYSLMSEEVYNEVLEIYNHYLRVKGTTYALANEVNQSENQLWECNVFANQDIMISIRMDSKHPKIKSYAKIPVDIGAGLEGDELRNVIKKEFVNCMNNLIDILRTKGFYYYYSGGGGDDNGDVQGS